MKFTRAQRTFQRYRTTKLYWYGLNIMADLSQNNCD